MVCARMGSPDFSLPYRIYILQEGRPGYLANSGWMDELGQLGWLSMRCCTAY